jgi:hypothetical protein
MATATLDGVAAGRCGGGAWNLFYGDTAVQNFVSRRNHPNYLNQLISMGPSPFPHSSAYRRFRRLSRFLSLLLERHFLFSINKTLLTLPYGFRTWRLTGVRISLPNSNGCRTCRSVDTCDGCLCGIRPDVGLLNSNMN